MKLKISFILLIISVLFVSCTTSNSDSSSDEKKEPVKNEITSVSSPKISLSYSNEAPEVITFNEMLNSSYTTDYTLSLKKGTLVTITCKESGVDIYYTLDGSEPTVNSTKYNQPFELDGKCTITAKAFYSKNNIESELTVLTVDKPYGRRLHQNRPEVCGDGVSEFYIFYEAKADKSGPDFSKQHYLIVIDTRMPNKDKSKYYDWVSFSAGSLAFDSSTPIQSSTYEIQNSIYYSDGPEYATYTVGSWTGTLWIKDKYILEEFETDYLPIYCEEKSS